MNILHSLDILQIIIGIVRFLIILLYQRMIIQLQKVFVVNRTSFQKNKFKKKKKTFR